MAVLIVANSVSKANMLFSCAHYSMKLTEILCVENLDPVVDLDGNSAIWVRLGCQWERLGEARWLCAAHVVGEC